MIANVMMDEKFTPQFIEFFEGNFESEDMKYLILSRHESLRYCEHVKDGDNVEIIRTSPKSLLKLLRHFKKSDAIILHGMFSKFLVYILWITGFSRKSFWCVYGGDLYSDDAEVGVYKFVKTRVIRKLEALIVGIPGDYDYAKRKYNLENDFFYCLGPNSAIIPDNAIQKQRHLDNINIILGNSADNENNHEFLIDAIRDKLNNKVSVYIPLSYGDQNYAEKIADYAKLNLKECAHPIRNFMSLSEYNLFLGTIDIAVYAHNRQQAFSNITQLISKGCKIYMKSNTTIYKWLKSCGIVVFDIDKVDDDFLMVLSEEQKKNNIKIIEQACSMDKIISQWEDVFKQINEFN